MSRFTNKIINGQKVNVLFILKNSEFTSSYETKKKKKCNCAGGFEHAGGESVKNARLKQHTNFMKDGHSNRKSSLLGHLMLALFLFNTR
jgi:hypothetical protein